MEIKNCRNCGKLFNYIGGIPLCPVCKKELDDKFSIVKEYVYDHPKATIQEISEDNDVSIAQLKQWIREERLSFSKDSPIGIACECCGTTIRTGRFCDACKEKMRRDFTSAYQKEGQQDRSKNTMKDSKMRYLDY